MREIFETAFFIAASLLVWGKVLAVVVGGIALTYFVYKAYKTTENMRMVRSYC